MKEQVIITQLRITKAGQVKHFQVKLPKNAKRIIGIEVGGRLIKTPKTDGTNGTGGTIGTDGTVIGVTPKEEQIAKQ